MRMFSKQEVSQDVINDVICDICSKSCWDDHRLNYELAVLTAHWGYYSHRDGDIWECDLCEECAIKVKEYIESLWGRVRVSS